MRRVLLAGIVMLWPACCLAGLTETQIQNVGMLPPANAHVPLTLSFKTIDNRQVTMEQAIAGRATLLLPADFTCKQICGPALTIAAQALKQTGLTAGRDYSLVVVGIDPRDSLADARRFTSGQVGGPGVSVLSGDEATIHALLASIGYRTERDTANDAIAHPASYVTLTAGGRLSRTLSSLALQATDLKLALIEASEGRIGGLTGRVALLCYGFDAVHGIYTRQIATILRIGGAAIIVMLVSTLGFMLWRKQKTLA